MWWCAACGVREAGPAPAVRLCRPCAGTVRPVPEFRTPAGLLVRAGAVHEGAARDLVHRLKYRAESPAAGPLVALMARAVEPTPACLVPIPRARVRRIRFGIDPAGELARRLGALLGWPVRYALEPGWWWPSHAGKGRIERARSTGAFRITRSLEAPWVLVDDVVTTGATAAAAAAALDSAEGRVIAAVAAGRVR